MRLLQGMGHHRRTVITGMLSIRSRPSIDSEASGTSETSVSWAGRDLMQGHCLSRRWQRSRVGGNTPIGQSACDLPRGMSILGCCRSNRSLEYNSSHLPTQSCGATRTHNASRPA